MMVSEAISRAQVRAPVDVHGLAADLGIRVHSAWLPKGVAGELVPLPGGAYQINVQAADPLTRQRFTIAHELGHSVLHRHLIGSGIGDDRAYRSTAIGTYHNTAIGPREEQEANRFASNLLMPDHLINSLKAAGYIDDASLAEALLVSLPAMRVRLGKPSRVGFVSQN